MVDVAAAGTGQTAVAIVIVFLGVPFCDGGDLFAVNEVYGCFLPFNDVACRFVPFRDRWIVQYFRYPDVVLSPRRVVYLRYVDDSLVGVMGSFVAR